MSVDEGVFEPLRGKRRAVRQALVEVAERWTRHPLRDAARQAALEDAIRHLLRRGQIRHELPAGADPSALARAFVEALVAGNAATAVEAVLGIAPGDGPSR
jgi:hypothetical protein